MTIKNILLFTLTVLVFSCQKDEWDYSFPYIKTIGVENVNDTSAVFTGEIVNLGNANITEYGCRIHYVGDIELLSDEIGNKEGEFSIKLSSYLRKDKTLFLTAYAKTNEYTVLGEQISYKCIESVLPEIISITPISGTTDTKRTMVVENFVENYGYSIKVGDTYIYAKSARSSNTIEFTLPYGFESGLYKVVLNNAGESEYSEELIVTAK